MKKLNNEQFNFSLKRVEDMANEKHEDYQVELLLADLWATIAEGYIWEWPKNIWRQWKIKEAVIKHKDCCPDLLEDI